MVLIGQNQIYFIGMMGAGKSVVGHVLATYLGYRFIDTDREIEKTRDMSIDEIFRTEGEKGFRKYEHQYFMSLKSLQRVVVSTGGGMPVYKDHLDRMKERGATIYLHAAATTLIDRLSGQTMRRPLLQNSHWESTVTELLETREDIYREAEYIVETDNKSVAEIVEEIIILLKRA